MNTESKLTTSASKITSLFPSAEETQKEVEKNRSHRNHFMRLNFILLTHFIKEVQSKDAGKKRNFSFFPLFIPKIFESKNAHLIEMTKQAASCCCKQDLHLMLYKQFLLRNELALKRIIEWKLSKYIKTQSQLDTLYFKMSQSSPNTFKQHLVTLIKLQKHQEADATNKNVIEEAKHQEDMWRLYRHHSDGGPSRISPT